MGLFKFFKGFVIGTIILAIGITTGILPLINIGAGLQLGAILGAVTSVLIPKLGAVQRLQQQTVLVRSAVKPQEILYGEDSKSGLVTFFGTSGTENEFLWFVIAIVEHEIDSYTTLWLDDVAIDIATEIDGSGFVTKSDFVNADSTNLVKTKFYTGLDSQTADADLVAAFTDWTTDHKGEGVAYLWVRLELDKSDGGNDPDNPQANVWSKGHPRDIAVTAKGAKVYDSRLDSTNGGSGAHRVNTPSTWEWSENPILCRTDYLRSTRFGPGYLDTEVNWPIFATQADICEEQVTLPGSPEVFQNRYTLNGVVTVDEDPKNIIETMQSADHGITLLRPAGIEVQAGAWDAPSWTIDETWLAGSVSVSTAIATDDAYNAVRGQYLSAAANYTLIEFQPRTSSAFETEDGVGRVWQDVLLPFANEEFLAQRIAIIELKKSRQQITVQIDCNFRGELVDIYQTVTLNLADFTTETFRVIGKTGGTDGITTLRLREEVAADWTFTIPDLATPPVIPSVLRDSDVIPSAPTGLTATSTPEGIRLEWTLPAGKALIQHIEIYANTSNGRASSSLVAIEPGESYLHQLPVGSDRWYWILARGINGVVSTWEPVSAFAGVAGTAGGENIVYYIKPLNGTAILNGSGTLTIEAHKIEGGVDTLLSAGTIKLFDPDSPQNDLTVANGYQTGSDGYTGVLDSSNINGSIVITMKDGVGGPALDTVSLVDIADGLAGDDAVHGFIEALNGLAWTRAPNSGAWTPSGLTTQLDVTFVQGGSIVAKLARLVTLTEATGVLGIDSGATPHTDGDLNTGRVSHAASGTGSTALTSKYTYSSGGDSAFVAETISSAQGGDDGSDARVVNLIAGDQTFEYDINDANPSPSSTTITATALNTTGTVYYEFFKNDVSQQNTTSNTYSYTAPASYTSMPEKIEVQIREGSNSNPILARDQLTISGLRAGGNAITVIVNNEAHTLPTTNLGGVTYTGSGTDLEVWEGINKVPYDGSSPYDSPSFRVSVSSSPNITPGSATTPSTYIRRYADHNSMTADQASIVYSIIVKNEAGVEATFTKKQSFAKSTEGDDGATGSQGATGAAGDDAITGYIEPSNGISWSRAVNDGVWSPSGLTSDIDVTFVKGGDVVARVASSVTVDSDDGTFSSSFTPSHPSGDLNTSRVSTAVSNPPGGNAITVRHTYAHQGDSLVNLSITCTTSQSGTDSISTQMDNANPIILTDNDGTGYATESSHSTTWVIVGSDGTYFVTFGSVDITGNLSNAYTVVGGAISGSLHFLTKNGATFAIHRTTGVYYVRTPSSDSVWSTDQETFTLRYTNGGVDWDKVYIITKHKAPS